MGRYRTVETELEARSYEARIWWALWGIALVILLYTAWHQIREYDLVHNGQSLEAEYYIYNGLEMARYIDENNRYHSYNVSGRYAVHEEDTITLYYKNSIAEARPRRSVKVWIAAYLLFGTAFVGFSLKLRRIYRQKLYKLYEE